MTLKDRNDEGYRQYVYGSASSQDGANAEGSTSSACTVPKSGNNKTIAAITKKTVPANRKDNNRLAYQSAP